MVRHLDSGTRRSLWRACLLCSIVLLSWGAYSSSSAAPALAVVPHAADWPDITTDAPDATSFVPNDTIPILGGSNVPPVAPGSPSPGCGQYATAGANVVDGFVANDGNTRYFRLHIPIGYNPFKPIPLIINFPGGGETAINQDQLTHMSRTANRNDFLVVYPQGMPRQNTSYAQKKYGFNIYPPGDTTTVTPNPWAYVDDVGFVDSLVGRLEARLCVDTTRIGATGLSVGGGMAYRLACANLPWLTAIAPIGAYVPQPLVPGQFQCQIPHPISLIAFQGTADPIVSFYGLPSKELPDIPTMVQRWSAFNGCAPSQSQTQPFYVNNDVIAFDYGPCPAYAQPSLYSEQLYQINGGGHSWPGGYPTKFGKTTTTIDASQLIYNFVVANPYQPASVVLTPIPTWTPTATATPYVYDAFVPLPSLTPTPSPTATASAIAAPPAAIATATPPLTLSPSATAVLSYVAPTVSPTPTAMTGDTAALAPPEPPRLITDLPDGALTLDVVSSYTFVADALPPRIPLQSSFAVTGVPLQPSTSSARPAALQPRTLWHWTYYTHVGGDGTARFLLRWGSTLQQGAQLSLHVTLTLGGQQVRRTFLLTVRQPRLPSQRLIRLLPTVYLTLPPLTSLSFTMRDLPPSATLQARFALQGIMRQEATVSHNSTPSTLWTRTLSLQTTAAGTAPVALTWGTLLRRADHLSLVMILDTATQRFVRTYTITVRP